jgi:hypothetical protein
LLKRALIEKKIALTKCLKIKKICNKRSTRQHKVLSDKALLAKPIKIKIPASFLKKDQALLDNCLRKTSVILIKQSIVNLHLIIVIINLRIKVKKSIRLNKTVKIR